jgi:hypothetical protein
MFTSSAADPIGDAEQIRQKVEAFFSKLEAEIGEKARTAAG